MKKFLMLALALTLVACGSDDNKSPNSGPNGNLADAIIGFWEFESLSGLEGMRQGMKKPDPSDPFAETDWGFSEWYQFKIDKKEVTLISTNFVTYSETSLPYKIEGSTIVTVDTEGLKMSDYKVLSFSQNKLSLKFISEGNEGPQPIFNFKRTTEDKMAYKSSVEATFKKSLQVKVVTEGETKVDMSKSVQGPADGEVLGLHDLISCQFTPKGNFKVSLSQIESTDDGWSTSSDNDFASLKVKAVDLQLKGPSSSISVTKESEVLIKTEKAIFMDKNMSCTLDVNRKGAVAAVTSSCKSADGKTQADFRASCLLSEGWDFDE